MQAGDTSADLTQQSSAALALNGGTIKDSAGNNAILTLAAPGAAGSLGANANIVVDGTAPRGALIVFDAATNNPYGLADVGGYASPSLVDIDGDGDLDALTGHQTGDTVVRLNTGSASAPAFGAANTNPYNLASVGGFASPSFVDIDGDGDLDALTGNLDGNTVVQLNTGSATSPAFAAASTNPYSLANVGSAASPSFVDIDGDGDLDALVGNNIGATVVQLNTGSRTAPAFGAANTNPYGLRSVGNYASPNFVDIDGDGDLDALIGNDFGNTVLQLNTGSTTSPAFAAPTPNPYGLARVGFLASPTLVDIDGDGDLDAVTGNGDGNTLVQLNKSVAPVTSTTANGTYGVGSVITFTIAFNEAVIVTTTGGTPSIALETGATDRAAVYTGGSNSTTLTFSYTVRAGDTSADLDVISANALKLNGGTIQDAAGNNAILTLAAPGAAGSLGANANIVIDGVAPRGALTGPINFANPTTNPYGLAGVGLHASPNLVDIDGDGDLDALIGNSDGNTLVQLNTGSANSPAFAAAANLYNLTDVGFSASPSFVDIDGDGDLDTLTGNSAGDTVVQLNTGSATSPAFASATTNPYGLLDVSASTTDFASPSFVDIDGDGDLDALIGEVSGNTVVQLNTGSATSPAFAAASTSLANVGNLANPSFVDIDGDGDLDALIGNGAGNTLLRLNTGSATSPAFAPAANIYNLTDVGYAASPSFVDIDGDGDMDALIGNRDGNTAVQLNTANPVAPVTSTTANGTYGVGSVITFTIAFNEAVIVTGTPSIALETGATDRAAVYTSGSNSTTLTFSYTVRAGDTSADLDVISANSLKLNGGTIRDAAGNNAILTLAAPGAAGSLGANANIVVDGTAPRGALTGPINFAPPTTNPYGLAGVGFFAKPSFVDIDGDGDLDALIGSDGGTTLLKLNTGSSTAPAFAVATPNPYGLTNSGYFNSPRFVDIDGDGDLDALTGGDAGDTVVQLNTGSSVSPAFAGTSTNPYGLLNAGSFTVPSLVDIDGDGDLDALIGNFRGNTVLQLNTGTSASPAFDVAATNPYGLVGVGSLASLNWVDIDGDGDLDALIGNRDGHTVVQLNTGSVTSPAFAPPNTNPYNLADAGTSSSPSFVDIDGDGDLDALIGNSDGNIVVQLNTGNRVAPVTATNANGTYGVGSMINLTVAFNEAVIVTGSPTLQLETGVTDRNAVYTSGSGTNTLTFSYTVQAGDTSADLDQASASALALNGGTIRDAAGNNAILTLAAPAAAGSLGANKAIVIDAPVPAPAPAPAPEVPNLDADGDGVPTAQENLVRPLTPTGLTGDGNGDGGLDSGQVNVASAPLTGNPNSFITVVADSNKGITDTDLGQAVITKFQIQAPPANLPSGANLANPISFNAAIGGTTGGVGQTETFSIFVDANTKPNGYWVKTANGAWNNIASSIETVGDKVRIDFAITDGGLFDADGAANGSIAVTGGAGNLPLSLIGQPPDLPPGGSFWF